MSSGHRLTLAHKALQHRIGAATAARVAPMWALLDPFDLDRTFIRWLSAVAPIVQEQFEVSAVAAARYIEAFRRAAGIAPAALPVAGSLSLTGLHTSMLVTGPVAVKSATARGVPIDRAMSVAEASSTAAASRHALSGGRGVVTSDPEARGHTRIAAARACGFCTSLAGIEYPSDHPFQAHDGCGCTAEPVYR